MKNMIFLQSNDLVDTLQDIFSWLDYLPMATNIILVIWIIAVFITWRMVSVRSIYGFLFGLFQSFLAFSVDTNLMQCEDVCFYLWICTGVNLIAIFSPVFEILTSRIFTTFIDSFNTIRDSFIFLFFNCMTFIILSKPHDFTIYDLSEYFSLNNFIEAVHPVFVCIN